MIIGYYHLNITLGFSSHELLGPQEVESTADVKLKQEALLETQYLPSEKCL